MAVYQVAHVPPHGNARLALLDRSDTRRAFRAGVNAVLDHYRTHSDPLGYTVSVVPVNAFTVCVQLFNHTGDLDAYLWVAVVPNRRSR